MVFFYYTHRHFKPLPPARLSFHAGEFYLVCMVLLDAW